MLSQIEGVVCVPYNVIPDDRGSVIKIKNPLFTVKDVYVTMARWGAIKAWHKYETKNIYWTIVSGMAQIGLVDGRLKSPTAGVTDTLYLGEGSFYSVLIPPGVWSGFKGISYENTIAVIQADEPYGQIYRIPYDEFAYDWGVKHG